MQRVYCDRCQDVRDGTPGWDRIGITRTTEDFAEQYTIDLCPSCIDELLEWVNSPHPHNRWKHDGEEKAIMARESSPSEYHTLYDTGTYPEDTPEPMQAVPRNMERS